MCFRHLSLEEREVLAIELARKTSLRSIAKRLGRDHTALGRELKKNTKCGKEYIPCRAQKRAVRVGNAQRYKAPLKGPRVSRPALSVSVEVARFVSIKKVKL